MQYRSLRYDGALPGRQLRNFLTFMPAKSVARSLARSLHSTRPMPRGPTDDSSEDEYVALLRWIPARLALSLHARRRRDLLRGERAGGRATERGPPSARARMGGLPPSFRRRPPCLQLHSPAADATPPARVKNVRKRGAGRVEFLKT